jgi:hypothetical protein
METESHNGAAIPSRLVVVTLDALCADSDIGSCSVGSGICRGGSYLKSGWPVPKIGVGSGCLRQGSLRLQDVNPLRSDVEKSSRCLEETEPTCAWISRPTIKI